MKYRIEVERNRGGKWFYRVRSKNSQILLTSQRQYASKRNAIRAAERIWLDLEKSFMYLEGRAYHE